MTNSGLTHFLNTLSFTFRQMLSESVLSSASRIGKEAGRDTRRADWQAGTRVRRHAAADAGPQAARPGADRADDPPRPAARAGVGGPGGHATHGAAMAQRLPGPGARRAAAAAGTRPDAADRRV